MYDNHSGWTVALEEGPHYYELMGNDYVLDLISEIEIVQGFPVCKSYTFVYTDHTAGPVGKRTSSNRYAFFVQSFFHSVHSLVFK